MEIAQSEVIALRQDIRTLDGQVREYARETELATNTVRLRMDEVEQKLARRGSGDYYVAAGGGGRQTLGGAVVEHAEFQRFLAGGKRGRVALNVPQSTMTALITSDPASGGSLVPVDTRVGPDDVVMLPRRRMTVRSLLAPGRTGGNTVLYSRENLFVNNAAVVPEGQPKPETQITFEPVSAPVATIAHWVRMSKQVADDAPALRATINNSLLYGLSYAEEIQLLFGDGTGSNLHGLVPQAEAYAPSFVPALANPTDDIGLAILQSELAELPATGVILNPIDWRRMMLTKDTIGRYIGSGPFVSGPNMLWGLPVVATSAMTQGKFLVGAFGIAAQIFDREEANVVISSEDASNFTSNLLTVLGEERLAMTVRRPQALVYGTYTSEPVET